MPQAQPRSVRPLPHALSGRALYWGLAVLALAAGGAGWWWKSSQAGAAGGPGVAASAASGAASGQQGPGGPGGRRFGGGNREQPVSVAPVRRQDVRVMVSAVGTLTASNTTTVRTQVGGQLQALLYKEGQQVKAGQQLAQIDPRSFQATLGQVEGTLARDKASLDNARIDLARYRDLLSKDAIAKQQVDTQEALVRQLEGTLKADQAAVDNAKLQLSYTKVIAPIPGRAGLKLADVGNIVSPGDSAGIVSITQTQPIALVFAVPSANLPQISSRLRANEPMQVDALDRNGGKFLATGKVATADNAIDLTTDTIKLKALFANKDEMLYPNQAVSVRLQLDTVKDALVVPPAAVLRGTQGFYVYVVAADSTVGVRVVKPGVVDGDAMVVEGNLEPGEKVVIDGVDRLRDGAKVVVIAADPRQRVGATGGGGRRGGRGGPGGASAPASGAAPAAAPAPERAASRGGKPQGAASAPAPAPAAAQAGAEERPRWLDRLPPEMQEKFMKMSPEERKAFIEKRRAERAAREGGGN
ncbi:MdtA/MuxA family multidrug efflux RND transporter periplasmic adaptor subunit [Pelomonas sp. SE-A7]|uniref:MdtA/MuxA family multidrug efflux RND transporter periplasmic adaptor subunit n=1 Tax=Pelomonas sp. SE-A7 TaxID=3054953 RepID=UPI00259D30FB|nr:MdtA/MuxA family multidrug efflux RND transporter periplasmic adaptor subunit [Pelomonas sp. SE-A7]MDM4767976.1 MdtA/MuxA family multidrug efflux RND transporter periplasmic adaptor subunit [Pelomonas sp. SE-A7]